MAKRMKVGKDELYFIPTEGSISALHNTASLTMSGFPDNDRPTPDNPIDAKKVKKNVRVSFSGDVIAQAIVRIKGGENLLSVLYGSLAGHPEFAAAEDV